LSNLKRALAVLTAVAITVGVVACSSDSKDDAQPSSTTSATNGSTVAGSTAPLAEGPGNVRPVNGQALEDLTLSLTADGTFDPDTLEVGVGEIFTVEADEKAGTHAVTFNGTDEFALAGDLFESFTIDAPGTYTAKDTVSGATATITVK